MSPSQSELIPIKFNMDLTQLGSKVSYTLSKLVCRFAGTTQIEKCVKNYKLNIF